MRNFLKVLLPGLLLAVGGCSAIPYAEIGAGKNKSFNNSAMPWEDAGDIAFIGELGVEWEHSGHTQTNCKYLHVSQWFAGPPFNNEKESSLDHFGCAIKFRMIRQ